ncbi:MAG: hypothetical protein R3F30_12855 [Planctomycetota bacterium]
MRLRLPLILPAGALLLGAGLWLLNAAGSPDAVPVTAGDGAAEALASPAAGGEAVDPAEAGAIGGPRRPYQLVPGQRMRFGLEAKVVQGTRSTLEDKSQEVRLTLGGELVVEVLGRDDDAWVLALSGTFAKAEMRIGTAPQAEPAAYLAQALAEPTLLRMAADGRPLGLRFPDGLEAEQENLVRDLVHRLRFVVDDGAEWRAVEADNSVEARYAYRWDPAPAADEPGVLRKQPLEVLHAPAEEFTARIAGDAEAVFDLRTGWFSACHVRGSLALGSESLPFELSYQHELSLHCLGVAFATSRSVAVADGPWASLEPRLADEVVAGPTGAEARRALDEVLAALIALFAEDPIDREAQFELRERLVALLRADPSLLEHLSPELDRYADRQALVNTILAAIGAVRSPEAQRFLADLVEDGGRAATLRLGATVALFQTDRPTPRSGPPRPAPGSRAGTRPSCATRGCSCSGPCRAARPRAPTPPMPGSSRSRRRARSAASCRCGSTPSATCATPACRAWSPATSGPRTGPCARPPCTGSRRRPAPRPRRSCPTT